MEVNKKVFNKKILILFSASLILFVSLSCEKKESSPQQSSEQKNEQTLESRPVPHDPRLPHLQAGKLILVGDQPLTVGHTASPEVVDWNNDGKKDLILGTYITFPNPIEEGKVMLLLNEGTDEAPLFKKGEFLQAAGEIISVGAG